MEEKIEYDRLLELAKKMHLWIFLHCGDENEVYKELGLTLGENEILGYSGPYYISTSNITLTDDGEVKNDA